MVDRLRVTELDFDTIKTNLKNFLRQQNNFTDYDFDGSGLSILLDILAYNTHYNAYYLNMVANESFLDTALLRDSVVSHAKTLGYTPYSTRSPVGVINLTIDSNSSTSSTCTLPEGFSFLSNQIDGVAYNFVVLNDVTVTKTDTQFIFENLNIYEGQLITYSFTHDESSNPKQIFTLPDTNIDTTTLKVTVAPSSSNTSTNIYTKVTDVLDVTATSEIYFLQEERNGRYQIYFGNDIIGKKLADGSIVSVTYLVTNGTVANKANNYVATSTVSDSLGNNLSNFTINPITAAAGGSERESVDRIKFSAANQFSTQNRLVTYKDYQSYILNRYPNIDSISVWGGETNDPPVYGKVFISLKPKSNYFISETEKNRIINDIVKPKAILSISAEIQDPEYLYLLLNSVVKYDSKKTTLSATQLQTQIRTAILSYKNTYLDKFNSLFSVSRFQDFIDSVNLNSIVGSETTVRLQRRFTPTLGTTSNYTLNFNVPLKRGTLIDRLTTTEFTTTDNLGVTRTALLEETPQSFTGISSIEIVNPGFGYTSAPTVTISGDGTGATAVATIQSGRIVSITVTNRGSATAVIDSRTGTLRTIYYDVSANRQIINSNAGTINYDTGVIEINDLRVLSVSSSDGLIRVTVESEDGVIESAKNTIVTIDEDDVSSIITTLETIST